MINKTFQHPDVYQLLVINKNISTPLIDNNSEIMNSISAFQTSHDFSNLNLIKYVSCKGVPTTMSKSFSFLMCRY